MSAVKSPDDMLHTGVVAGLLEGTTALVTGGSTGIGLAGAVRLAVEGAVFITGRRKTELDPAVESGRQRSGHGPDATYTLAPIGP